MPMDERYPLALPEGTILAGQYVIEKVLGQGGFGITYRATDHKTNQKVAVKEFFPDTLAYREMTTVISYPGERSENYAYGKESFLQEAKTLAEFIGNVNIVRIHSYFEENGTAYFVMDYIEGKSFDEYIKEKGGKVSVEEAKNILVPVMDALGVVHSKGIVHRDVTPDNIYITDDGTVKLLDFGAARYSLGDKSRSLDVILKHGFAPKEQYTRRGKQGPFTDIYSLGATFYFAITGKRPPDSVERLDEDDLIPPSNLGVNITEYQERAILQALSVQPAERFQSMAEFKKILLNENTATNQIFFTAPEAGAVPPAYQAPPVAWQGVPTVQQGNSAGQNAGQLTEKAAPVVRSVQQKLQKIKHIKLIAVIVCAMVVVFFVGRAFFGKSEKDANMASSNKQTSSPEPVTYDANELIVVGNTAGNLKNNGVYTTDGNMMFWIDDGGHSLASADEFLFQNLEGQFFSLSYYGGILYYIYDGTAYSRNIAAGSVDKIIPELEAYKGNITSLYVTTGCYFIYKDGKLYRISRKTGQEEEWIAISDSKNFTIDRGWLYYIAEDSEGRSNLFKTKADDFSVENSSIYVTAGYLSDPVVAGNYVYVLGHNGAETSIWGFHLDLQIYGDEIQYIISDFVNANSNSSYIVSSLNAIGNNLFFTTYNADDNTYPLYHLIGNGTDSGYDSEFVALSAFLPNLTGRENNYVLHYFAPGENSSGTVLYYMSFN